MDELNIFTHQVDGGVEVFPDESIVPHIPREEQDLNLSHLPNQLPIGVGDKSNFSITIIFR